MEPAAQHNNPSCDIFMFLHIHASPSSGVLAFVSPIIYALLSFYIRSIFKSTILSPFFPLATATNLVFLIFLISLTTSYVLTLSPTNEILFGSVISTTYIVFPTEE